MVSIKDKAMVVICFCSIAAFLVLLLIGMGCEKKPASQVSGPECVSDSDCVPDACCHATGCVAKDKAPKCEGMMCTMECRPNTLDCYGRCACEGGICKAKIEQQGSDVIV